MRRISIGPEEGSGTTQWEGAMRRMTVETIADIDVQLVSARWRVLHNEWEGNADDAGRASATIDALLERRYRLTRPAGAGTNESAAA